MASIKEIIEKQRQRERVALETYSKVLHRCGAEITQACIAYSQELKDAEKETEDAIKARMR